MMDTENLKTLLVIGNGFDLAHGLKTRYTDFLDFINREWTNHIENSIDKKMIKRESLSEDHDNPHLPSTKDENKHFRNHLRDTYWEELEENAEDFKLIQKAQSNIRSNLLNGTLKSSQILDYMFRFDNTWIRYFNSIRDDKSRNIGENWVDFEKEIEDIILDAEKLLLGKSVKDSDFDFMAMDYDRIPLKTISQSIIPRMVWDLKILTLAFEFYLIDVISTTDLYSLKFINTMPNISAIISYNYSNVWQKVYDAEEKVKPYFIHGELGKHNLVLGIGETLPKDLENQLVECADFKKFFQRIKYRLGNEHQRIANMDFGKHHKWQVVIYGHSLDPTDKDSLYWLLSKSTRFQTTIENFVIYYYDESAYNQQIKNLVQIIGKDNLINDVNSGRIIFKLVDNYK